MKAVSHLHAGAENVANVEDWSKCTFQSTSHWVQSKTPFPLNGSRDCEEHMAADLYRELKISFFNSVSGSVTAPPWDFSSWGD